MNEVRGRDSQPSLPLGGLVCEVCPYGVSGRCDGYTTATVESFVMQGPSVIGCLDSSRQASYFLDLYGQRSYKPKKAHHSSLLLPRFIPEMATGLRQAPKFNPKTLFGVSLSTLLSEEGIIKYKSPEALRKALRLSPYARLALIGTAIDFTIEKFWHLSEKQDAWRRIAALNFEFATSFTYSVWNKYPRFDQIFNQDRNFATYDYLLANKIPSIPFLFFYNRRDYREIIAWLRDHQDVHKIAVLAQFYESSSKFEQLFEDMRAYQEDALRPLHFVIIGASKPSKIRKVLDEFSNVTIITHQPIFKALMGFRTLPDLSHIKADVSVGHGILAVNNIAQFQRYCSRSRVSKRSLPSKNSHGAQLNLLQIS
jgi:hypothetical protein